VILQQRAVRSLHFLERVKNGCYDHHVNQPHKSSCSQDQENDDATRFQQAKRESGHAGAVSIDGARVGTSSRTSKYGKEDNLPEMLLSSSYGGKEMHMYVYIIACIRYVALWVLLLTTNGHPY
jgi:hypothetical protein